MKRTFDNAKHFALRLFGCGLARCAPSSAARMFDELQPHD
jgi:hypothetical protein